MREIVQATRGGKYYEIYGPRPLWKFTQPPHFLEAFLTTRRLEGPEEAGGALGNKVSSARTRARLSRMTWEVWSKEARALASSAACEATQAGVTSSREERALLPTGGAGGFKKVRKGNSRYEEERTGRRTRGAGTFLACRSSRGGSSATRKDNGHRTSGRSAGRTSGTRTGTRSQRRRGTSASRKREDFAFDGGSAGDIGGTIGATLSMASKGATEAAGRLTSAADTKTIQPRGILAVTAAPTLGIVQLKETFRKTDVKG